MTSDPAGAHASACDTHMHIYDPAFAPQPGGLLPRIPATVAQYAKVMARLAIGRCVVVQPSAYAFDNSCAEAAVATLGRATARGVAMVRPDVSDTELRRLHDAGFRGARFHVGWAGEASWGELHMLAPRLAGLGWQASIQFNGRMLPQRFDILNALPCPLVIEHAGKFDPIADAKDTAFALLKRLLYNGRTWVKISEPYAVSRSGPPDYDDFSVLARALVAHAPERVVWATNWPHPSATGELPDDLGLHILLDRWVPDPALRQRILVENPERLFGFAD